MFKVYLVGSMGNEIGDIMGQPIKSFTVATLVVNDGLLKKGNYYIPLQHILFIKEV